MPGGRILPVSSELALNRGIRGMYHLLLDQAGKTRGKAGVNELTSFIGRLHEADLLRPDTSDWVSTRWLTIIGQDSPPF
jgi:hypothetical protein